jgi:hypothetical protein
MYRGMTKRKAVPEPNVVNAWLRIKRETKVGRDSSELFVEPRT